MNLRDQILATYGKRRTTSVPIDGFDDPVFIQSITENERARWEEISEKDRARGEVYLISLALIDEHGRRLFSEDDAKDLLEIDASVASKLRKPILQHVFEIATTDDNLKN